jgi:glyoxylase-like metal-dependent hydrolase (beta-lactamase superfamily II)
LLFHQLFEPQSSTYTYLLGCTHTGKALLVDPVLETFSRDLDLIRDLNLELALALDTHIHADHLTSALKLRAITGCQIAVPQAANVACADVHVTEQAPVNVGRIQLKPLFTPGHTDHHHCYGIETEGTGAVLTGDCLLIDGCGRTDFQGGSSQDLYRSIQSKLFTLPADTLVYPGHDYQGRRISTIGQERTRNPRLKDGTDAETFDKIMDELNLPYPQKMDLAVPANMLCGQCPDDLPTDMERLCDITQQG